MSTVTNDSTQSTTSTSSSGTVASNGDSISDLFTTLLVAQIRNQNPLDPADPSEFVGQLTQLSQTEALQKLVSQGANSAAALESMQVMALGAQVGSQVSVRTDSVVVGDEPIAGRFTLASASATTAVVLTDAAGKTYRMELGTHAPGEVDFKIDPDKLGLPAGSYSVAVSTTSGEKPGIDIDGTLQSVKLSTTAGVVLNVSNVGSVSSTVVTGFNGRA
ncbi:MAG: flagellar hook capping FlgD N-terminal domain-containing protein [Rhodocyclaceae bacterium]